MVVKQPEEKVQRALTFFEDTKRKFNTIWRFEKMWTPKYVTLLGDVSLMEEVCHCGGGL